MGCITRCGCPSTKERVGPLRPLRRDSYNRWAGGSNSSSCIPQSRSCDASVPTAGIRSIGRGAVTIPLLFPVDATIHRYNNTLNSSLTAPCLPPISLSSGSCNLSITKHRHSSRISKCTSSLPSLLGHPRIPISIRPSTSPSRRLDTPL